MGKGGTGYQSGADTVVFCQEGCHQDCGTTDHFTNHIAWEVKNEGSADATISWDTCNAVLNLGVWRLLAWK